MMSSFYQSLANLIVVVHFGYMAFVVLGQLAILAGVLLKWRWVRNLWFRSIHMTAILIVVVQALAGLSCPLTVWEQSLRDLAGQDSYRGDFIANCVHRLLFFEFDPWVFTTAYCLFGAIVLGTFIFAPPRLGANSSFGGRAGG